MSTTVNHHPETHYPITRTMEIAERGSGAQADAHLHEGNTKLIPWLMLTAILSGIAVAIAVMGVVNASQNEARTRTELDKQNRFLQEYRIRVEDAEIAAEEVNPKFHPRRTE